MSAVSPAAQHNPGIADLKVRLDRCGVHLFDRRSGLNILADEVEVAPSDWARAPRHLSIALTNACELACPYCYAPKYRARLDVERILSWLVEVDGAGCLGVGFGGGEPTLAPGFATLCQRVAEETALAVSFTTHGHRLTADLVDRLSGHVHFLRVSVDGTNEVYERHRGRPFAQIVSKLKLAGHLAPLGINVVVNDATLGCLDELAELAHTVGARELLLLPEQPARDRPGLDEAGSSRLADWVASNAGSIRLAVSEEGAEGLAIAEPFGDQPMLERYAHIDASGRLRASSYSLRSVTIAQRPFLDAYTELQQMENR